MTEGKYLGVPRSATDSINVGWDEQRAPMEVRRMFEAVYDATSGMTHAEHRVLNKVMFLDREEGLGCHAKPKNLGAMLNMSPRSVRRCLDALIRKGLIRATDDGYRKGHEVVWPFDDFPPAINELGNHRAEAVEHWSTQLSEYMRQHQGPGLTLHSGTDG